MMHSVRVVWFVPNSSTGGSSSIWPHAHTLETLWPVGVFEHGLLHADLHRFQTPKTKASSSSTTTTTITEYIARETEVAFSLINLMAMATTTTEKRVMVVGMDESDYSLYAIQWTLDHFFTPFAPNPPYKLVIVYAKPTLASVVGFMGPVAADVMSIIELDLKKIAAATIEKAKEICGSKSVNDVVVEAVQGDARNVICDAVEKHHAAILVVGSHGYGVIKRAVLGSVSDYCAHHAQCNVMIVKKPNIKH